MNKFVSENLMLLEFLVDEIFFTAPTQKKINSVNGETNVMFHFLDNKPIIITANELQNSCAGSETRCGKSCLFSMTTEQGVEALGNFLIQIKIFQKFPPGVLPNAIDIACGEICISELFQELMESAMGSTEKAWVKCQKETVKLYMCGECVGSVSVFVRMSCYGKYIVTQCEMNMGDFQDRKQQSCLDQNVPKQTKCLPLPDTLVKEAKGTKDKEKMPKRQIGAGEIINEDPCNTITRQSIDTCMEKQGDNNFSQVGARDMAFQMLDAPQWDGSPQPLNQNQSKDPYSQMSRNYPSYSSYPSPGIVGFPQEVTSCNPCPVSLQTTEFAPREIMARPPQKRVVAKKPSKDKILVRLHMPKYGPKDDCNKPYELEFVTPAGWARESQGRQCRDGQCDCRDFPCGYLEKYYGKEQLAALLNEQFNEEMRREKVYGKCPVGQFANVKRPKGGLKELYFKCLGASGMKSGKQKKEKKGKKAKKTGKGKKGGKSKEGGEGGKKKGGKKKSKDGGEKKAKKGGMKKAKKAETKSDTESSEDETSEASTVKTKTKQTYFRPKRKLQKHGGITVPDRKPVCDPCHPCGICLRGSSPCRPCSPCSLYGTCGPCGTMRPSSAYGTCGMRTVSECSRPYTWSANQSPCPSCCRKFL